ncbi:hypothetical protein ACVV62_09430 [Streptococcus pluranimalium]
MAVTRTMEELTEIAEYVLSVMTEEEQDNYLGMTDEEQRSVIAKHLSMRG